MSRIVPQYGYSTDGRYRVLSAALEENGVLIEDFDQMVVVLSKHPHNCNCRIHQKARK